MKYKTTTKALRAYATNLKSAGYCELQYLLNGVEPSAYTCGVYGWNFDVYHIHGLTICTGYRGMPGERLQDCTKYERAASEILSNYKIPYDERRERVAALLKEFCILNGGY